MENMHTDVRMKKRLSLHLKTLCLTIHMKATERGTAYYTVGTAWH